MNKFKPCLFWRHPFNFRVGAWPLDYRYYRLFRASGAQHLSFGPKLLGAVRIPSPTSLLNPGNFLRRSQRSLAACF